MKRSLRYFVAASALLPILALGGYVQPFPVFVEILPDTSGTAAGDMWTARSSKNDIEFIGCGIRSFDLGGGGDFDFGFCQASDADGNLGFCQTQSPEILDTLKSISDGSFIVFSWNADGECTRIGSSTQSFYLPRYTTRGEPDLED